MTDSRKKGCPNSGCQMNQKKIKQKSSEVYCPKCGSRLVYVCSKCFREIEDISPKHKYCLNCEAVADDRKDRVKEGLKKTAGAAGAAAVSVVAFVGRKGLDTAKKEVANVVSRITKDAINNVLKK